MNLSKMIYGNRTDLKFKMWFDIEVFFSSSIQKIFPIESYIYVFEFAFLSK